MKIEKKTRTLLIMEGICRTIFTYALLSTIYFFFTQYIMNPFYILIILSLDAILFILKKKIQNKLMFLSYLFIAAVVMFIICAIIEIYIPFIAIAILTLLYCLATFYPTTSDLESPNWIMVFMIMAMGIYIYLMSNSSLIITFYILETIYTITFIIYSKLYRVNKFIWDNNETAFIYIDSLVSANKLITIVLMMLICLIGIISASTIGPILNSRLDNLHINDITIDDKSEEVIIDKIDEVQQDKRPKLMVESILPIGELGKTLEKIILIIFVIIGVVFLIGLPYYVFLQIKLLSKNTDEDDIKEYILPSKDKDLLDTVYNYDDNKNNDSPSYAIRRLYKKTIKPPHKNGHKFRLTDTPTEQMISAGYSGEFSDNFVELYRKARYSNAKLSEDDYQSMVKYHKKLKR